MTLASSRDGLACRCLMVFLQLFCLKMFVASLVFRIFLNIWLGIGTLRPCALQQSHGDFHVDTLHAFQTQCIFALGMRTHIL